VEDALVVLVVVLAQVQVQLVVVHQPLYQGVCLYQGVYLDQGLCL
jgi:hypothetical protein